jgi:hypothetical protein
MSHEEAAQANDGRSQSVATITIDSIPLPIQDVIVCPVTGRALVRNQSLASERGIHSGVHVARTLSASAGKTPGRRATLVDPEVDEKSVR